MDYSNKIVVAIVSATCRISQYKEHISKIRIDLNHADLNVQARQSENKLLAVKLQQVRRNENRRYSMIKIIQLELKY